MDRQIPVDRQGAALAPGVGPCCATAGCVFSGYDCEAETVVYTLSNREAGLVEAQTLITEAAADANSRDGDTDFTFQLIGVIDDPFAVA